MPTILQKQPGDAEQGLPPPVNGGRAHARRFGLAVACVTALIGAGQAWLGSSRFVAQGLTHRLDEAASSWPDAAELAQITSRVDHYLPASQPNDSKAATWTIGHRVVMRGSDNSEQAFDVVGIAPLAPNALPGTEAPSAELVVVTLKPVVIPDLPAGATGHLIRMIVDAADVAAPGAAARPRPGNRTL